MLVDRKTKERSTSQLDDCVDVDVLSRRENSGILEELNTRIPDSDSITANDNHMIPDNTKYGSKEGKRIPTKIEEQFEISLRFYETSHRLAFSLVLC